MRTCLFIDWLWCFWEVIHYFCFMFLRGCKLFSYHIPETLEPIFVLCFWEVITYFPAMFLRGHTDVGAMILRGKTTFLLRFYQIRTSPNWSCHFPEDLIVLYTNHTVLSILWVISASVQPCCFLDCLGFHFRETSRLNSKHRENFTPTSDGGLLLLRNKKGASART